MANSMNFNEVLLKAMREQEEDKNTYHSHTDEEFMNMAPEATDFDETSRRIYLANVQERKDNGDYVNPSQLNPYLRLEAYRAVWNSIFDHYIENAYAGRDTTITIYRDKKNYTFSMLEALTYMNVALDKLL